MATPRVCVLRAPGTNCDHETAFAFEQAGGKADRVHLFRALETPSQLNGFQILCIPGGFSYGDDVAAGAIFAAHLRSSLQDAITRFVERDTLVLGICNGFQTLLKSGILPDRQVQPKSGDGATPREATLTWNQNGRYTARWVRLHNPSDNNVFLRGVEEIELPIAHAEGRIAVSDDDVLDRWKTREQIALTYCEALDEMVSSGPFNPNGSVADIAGLGDPTGRVLGLMPHPERYLFGHQHPQWTRRRLPEEGAGAKLFSNAVGYFA